MSDVKSQQPLCDIALICCDLFAELLQFSDARHGPKLVERLSNLFPHKSRKTSNMDLSDLADEFEQYCAWAKNLGVFASDNSSLDFRLREAPEVKKNISSLLRDLKEDLRESLSLVWRDREIDEFPMLEDSESDSDSDSDSNESSQRVNISNGVSLATKLAAYELQCRFRNISELISHLIRLAQVIRASGARSRFTRAARYEIIEDGIDQITNFEMNCLPRVLRHRFNVPEPLIDRLAKAISSRRRRFLYQSKHQKGLAYGIAGKRGRPPTPANDLGLLRLMPSRAGNEEQLVRPQISKQIVLGSQMNSEVPTTATTFRMQNVPRALSSIVSGSQRSSAAQVELPPPPPQLSGSSTHFECPYCCLLVPESKRQERLWHQHVVDDIQPFVCIEVDCLTPDVLLESRNDWLQHQLHAHATEWWCEGDDFTHTPTKFLSEEAFVDHLQKLHPTLCPEGANVTGLVHAASHPSLEPFRCCPFCDYLPETLATASIDDFNPIPHSTARQKALQAHIRQELLTMFLLALPEHDEAPGSTSGSNSERNLSSRSTVKPSGTEILVFEDSLPRLIVEAPQAADPATIEQLWSAVWASPQLKGSVREKYDGLKNDPNISRMIQHPEHRTNNNGAQAVLDEQLTEGRGHTPSSQSIEDTIIAKLGEWMDFAMVGPSDPSSLSALDLLRLVDADLQAVIMLYRQDKAKTSRLHFYRTLEYLKEELFRSYFVGIPLQLLFHVSALQVCGIPRIATGLLKHCSHMAELLFPKTDSRYQLYKLFEQIPTPSLQQLHRRATEYTVKRLEVRTGNEDDLLHSMRMQLIMSHTAYTDPGDASESQLPLEDINHDGGDDRDNVSSIDRRLLRAFQLVSCGRRNEAMTLIRQTRERFHASESNAIDEWALGLLYQRFGAKEYQMKHYENARDSFNTALDYLNPEKIGTDAFRAVIGQCQLLISRRLGDTQNEQRWMEELAQHEKSMQQWANDTLEARLLEDLEAEEGQAPGPSRGESLSPYITSRLRGTRERAVESVGGTYGG